MKKYIADANFFLRFLLNDIPSQTKIAREYLVDAKKGKLKSRLDANKPLIDKLAEVPIIEPNDPDNTANDNGINNCEAGIFLIRPQSFTTCNSNATSVVLFRNIDRAKHRKNNFKGFN